MTQLQEFNFVRPAIDSLGLSPPNLWFFTINLSTKHRVGTKKWSDLNRPNQCKYLLNFYLKYFSYLHPKGVLVFEETKAGNIHLHCLLTATYSTVGDFKDELIKLKVNSTAIALSDPHNIAFDIQFVKSFDKVTEYLEKGPYKVFAYKREDCPTYIRYDPKQMKKIKCNPKLSKDLDINIKK